MYLAQSTSAVSHDQKRSKAKQKDPKKHHVNWHEAAVCAIQIELRNYTHMLEFLPEYVLGKNSNRIDLLIIKKLSEQAIPKNIARITAVVSSVWALGTLQVVSEIVAVS